MIRPSSRSALPPPAGYTSLSARACKPCATTTGALYFDQVLDAIEATYQLLLPDAVAGAERRFGAVDAARLHLAREAPRSRSTGSSTLASSSRAASSATPASRRRKPGKAALRSGSRFRPPARMTVVLFYAPGNGLVGRAPTICHGDY